MLVKYFNNALKLELTPKALKYANSKGDRLKIYYYEDKEKDNDKGYGLEFRGKDFHFISMELISVYLENLATIEE